MSKTFSIGGDLTVNRLGFGAMRITGSGIWGWPPDRENAKKVLRRAIELGVNLIDTADAYGPETSELLIAEALHPYPQGLVIATKGGLTRPGQGAWVPNCRPEYLSQCVDKSLKRLKLQRIDLYQLHTVDRKVPIEDSVGALKKATGRRENPAHRIIERLGEGDRASEESCADRERPEPLQPDRPRLAGRARLLREREDGIFALGANWRKRAKLVDQIRGLIGSKKRLNYNPVQLALAWLLRKSPVMLPIPGTANVAHLEENMAAAKIQLSPEEWKKIEAAG